ncbi:heme-NO-binding protein [Aliiruegeria haliotis]|uniref:Heme-NO-binding protein n=1 Tax=Aliiruegeria haliotis TaxID=1280846 RepID=A0A2T0RUN0_9RHOB|nr:heme NO-binding domain-containing protein [Aliiruegeria haliotis]PRY24905.1 heme-NO-binding protein [Aliiruegeria haliotis]
MHGLVNRSIQCFVRDTYGLDLWGEVAAAIGIEPEGFEALFSYDDELTERMIATISERLHKPEAMVLEDVGTYLISNREAEAVRRLLRFGGDTFSELLNSLDDLPDRARLAVPDLEIPQLEVADGEDGILTLSVTGHPGFACVLLGVLRALADDYGALVLMDLEESGADRSIILIRIFDSDFSEGRAFSLANPSGASGRDGR